LVGVLVSGEVLAAKRDFKGLFGSYRREKFTENEAQSSDFGMDLMLSTLLPLSPTVKSQESTGGAQTALGASNFFNLETSFFLTMGYHFQFYALVGYYTYETRKENGTRGNADPTLPLFHQFEMTAFPALLGIKYRFSTSDIVPYIGAGAGMSFVSRKASYDYSTSNFTDNTTALTGQGLIGVEFFFAPRAGIRLEAAGMYMNLAATTFDTGGSPTSNPIMYLQGGLLAMRYASGLFILF